MSYKKSVQYLVAGLVTFFSLITIAIVIRPAGLFVNSGISYYGNWNETVIPYGLAFIVNSYLLWRASSYIGNKNKIDIGLEIVLRITAVLMIGILLTPYNVFNMTSLNYVHRTIGTAMFSVQMVMAVSIVISNYRDPKYLLLITSTFIGGIGALVYLLQPTGYMIESQIIFQISIWLIFIRYLSFADMQLTKRVV